MRSHLRIIGLAVLAIVLSLIASEGANAARLNYTGQTATNVSVDYFDLPAGTTIVFLNRVSGTKIATPTPLLTGSGSLTIPFSALPPVPGQYYVLALQGTLWVAASVMFYVTWPP
jgi:hypothetical protein